MKRVLAVMGAVVMILIAVLIRSVIDNDNSSGGSKNSGIGGGPVKILCSTELKEICSSLAEDGGVSITVTDPGATVDALTAGTAADFDAWLTVGPWERVLEDNLVYARPSSGETERRDPLGPGQILAKSPVVFVSVNDKATERVAAACGADPAVSCASSDTSLSIGIPSTRRGDGLVGLAQATAGRLGKADFDANDLADSDLSSWIATLANKSRSAKIGTSNALTIAVTKAGQFQAVVALEANTVASANRLGSAKVTYPKPVMTADVHLIARASAMSSDPSKGQVREVPADTVNRIKELLAKSGWRVDGRVPAGVSGPALPNSDGLPEPGVLQVLRESWGKDG